MALAVVFIWEQGGSPVRGTVDSFGDATTSSCGSDRHPGIFAFFAAALDRKTDPNIGRKNAQGTQKKKKTCRARTWLWEKLLTTKTPEKRMGTVAAAPVRPNCRSGFTPR